MQKNLNILESALYMKSGGVLVSKFIIWISYTLDVYHLQYATDMKQTSREADYNLQRPLWHIFMNTCARHSATNRLILRPSTTCRVVHCKTH